jgi:Cft2 family RNA processing exonuclease
LGFKGKIFGTKVTIALTKIMLEDSLRINKELDYKTIENMKFIEFDKNHGENIFKGFGKKYVPIGKDFFVTILRTSHVLGSCSWLFQWTEKKYKDNVPFNDKEWKYIYFTGDIGPGRGDFNPNILFKDHQIPFDNPHKFIVLESTYGNITREKSNDFYENKIAKLAEIIENNIEQNRSVIIPVFALDRAQQILIDLYYINTKHKIDNKSLLQRIHERKKPELYNKLCDKDRNNIIDAFDFSKIKKRNKKQMKINEIFYNENVVLFKELSEENRETILSMFKGEINFQIGIKSPLIRKINEIYIDHSPDDVFSKKDGIQKYIYLSDEFIKKFNIGGKIASTEQKDKVREILKKCLLENKTEKGNIIVSASGMCDDGAVLDLLKENLRNEKATIILTGYQAKGTNGYLLKNLIKGKYDEDNLKSKISLNKIDLKLSDIKCKIEDLSGYYSGHADQEQLVNYVLESNKKAIKTTVLINHGSEEAREKLKGAIEEKGDKNISILLPQFNKWINISNRHVFQKMKIKAIELFKKVLKLQFLNSFLKLIIKNRLHNNCP